MITICYLIIYILECLIFWQYCRDIFEPKYPRKTEAVSLFLGYTILFVFSLFGNAILNFILFVSINLILCYFLFSPHWSLAFFYSFTASIIMIASELIILSIISYFSPDFYGSFRNILIGGILSKFIYYFILRIISLHFFKKNSGTSKMTIFLLLVPLMSSFITITLAIICMKTKMPLILDVLISISGVLILGINLFISWCFSYIQKQDKQFLQMQLQIQKEKNNNAYFDMLLQQYEKQQILIHDTKKHLNSILLLNSEKKNEKITSYIHDIIKRADLQNPIRVSDNSFLNGILQQYIIKCKEKHIDFKTDIRSKVINFLSYEELTAVFCNLLDNALDASKNLPDSYIELSVTNPENKPFVLISMINTCDKNPFSGDGKLETKKKDHWQHGYGLKSITNILKKYNGEMNLYFDSHTKTFHSILLFYIK